jgi:hypothetical protein
MAKKTAKPSTGFIKLTPKQREQLQKHVDAVNKTWTAYQKELKKFEAFVAKYE